MSKMKVAIVSHDIAWRDIEENVITVADLLNRVDRDCDIVVLPELFTTGNILSKEDVTDLAEDENGIAIVNVQRWSQFFGFAICGTFLAKDNGKFYNRAFFAEPFGDITYYDKRHIRSNKEPIIVGLDSGIDLSPIIRYCGWNISIQTGSDIMYPIWCRATAINSDVIINPSSWQDDEANKNKHLMIARAIENQVYFIGANRIGVDNYFKYNSPSLIIDYKGMDISYQLDSTKITYAILEKEPLLNYRKSHDYQINADKFKLL